MMKKWIFLLLIPLLMGSTTSTRVKFFKGNLSIAKEEAARQGKLYFVDFTASWCMPCRWMDETTFSDPTLAQYIQEHYIPVKVDIDDFDGYAYKQLYNIRMLPSILIFNSKGKLVAQYEESMAPSKMLTILKQHNTPANRVRQEGPASYGQPEAGITEAPAPVAQEEEVTTPAPINRPAPVSRPQKQKPPTAVSRPMPSSPRPTPPADKPKIRTNTNQNQTILAPGSGLYRFKVSRQASEGFSIQTGVYGQYGNVLREAAKLENQFNQPVIVHIAQLAGKPVYKVLIGEFTGRAEATAFQQELKNKDMEVMIKDLSTLMP